MPVSEHLISQYDKATKLKAIIDLFDTMLQDNIGAALSDLLPNMTSKAEGYWLELLSKRFGTNRPLLSDPAQAKFFGLNGAILTGKIGFDQAPFSETSTTPNRVYATDELFSKLIAMESSRLRMSGTQDEITAILDGIYPESRVLDIQSAIPRSIIIEVNTNVIATIHSFSGGRALYISEESGVYAGWDTTESRWEAGTTYYIGEVLTLDPLAYHPASTGILPPKTGWVGIGIFDPPS